MAGLKCYQVAVLLLLSYNALSAAHEVAASETGVASQTATLDIVESTAERSLQVKKPKCPGNQTAFPLTKTVISYVKKGKRTVKVVKTVIYGYVCKCKPGEKQIGKYCFIPPKPSPKVG